MRTLILLLAAGALVACSADRPDAAPDRSAAGAPITLVQPDTGFYQEISWHPGGGELLVSVLAADESESGFVYRIWELRLDGSGAEALTDGPRDYWTSWSPDGSAFVFNGERGASSDIFVMDADGSNRRPLTEDPARDAQPDWSPDGARIAFISDRDGPEQVWVMRADGTSHRRLVEGVGQAQNPRWSPDGEHIAFYETDPDGRNFLAIAGADGEGRRRLVEGVWPSWTPDGRELLYTGADGLYLIGMDGSAAKRLFVGDFVNGEISPDGSRVAFIEKVDGDVLVGVMALDGSDRHVLMRRPAPSWG